MARASNGPKVNGDGYTHLKVVCPAVCCVSAISARFVAEISDRVSSQQSSCRGSLQAATAPASPRLVLCSFVFL